MTQGESGFPDNVIDLVRERRIRANLAKLRALLADDPRLAERTMRALRGQLAAPQLQAPSKG